MTEFLMVVAIGALIYRIKTGLFTRAEAIVFALVSISFVAVWLQILIGVENYFFPERRYYIQSFIVFYPWGIWGLAELARKVRKSPLLIMLPVMIISATFALVMLFKAMFPVGRRAAYIAATEWAANEIRADWKGPARGAKVFSAEQYHPPYRPIVDGFSRRIAYVVSGTRLSKHFKDIEQADYWVGDLRRDKPPAEGYAKMGEYKHGKYTFELYRKQ